MGWRNRKEREFDRISQGHTTEEDESSREEERKRRKYRRENRVQTLKKMVPLAIGIIFGGFLTRGLLESVIGGDISIAMGMASAIIAFLIIWWITVRTYIPPGVTYTQFGHVKKDDTNSMIYIGDVLIPKDLITLISQNAPNYEVLRPFGVSNLAESVEWNEETGEVTIKSPEGILNEPAFFEKHRTFHEQEKIIQIQGETINNYEKYVKVELPRLAFKMAEDMINKVSATFFDPVTGEKIGRELKTELERQKRDILDISHGSRASRSSPPMTEGLEDGQ